eukprot:m.155203 g.155203  ORF g.155203 m.155203 type:complete len:57 (+) comp23551_c0_seq1:269-439(+)
MSTLQIGLSHPGCQLESTRQVLCLVRAEARLWFRTADFSRHTLITKQLWDGLETQN